ncbi:hypothetical protein HNP40_002853 [Mycobacteroides chelonae]|nr:hypothetical protein [Mycobacteroides chelonae]
MRKVNIRARWLAGLAGVVLVLAYLADWDGAIADRAHGTAFADGCQSKLRTVQLGTYALVALGLFTLAAAVSIGTGRPVSAHTICVPATRRYRPLE